MSDRESLPNQSSAQPIVIRENIDSLSASLSDQIEMLAGELRSRWRSGQRVSIETLGAAFAQVAKNDEQLLDLVYHEVLIREEFGEKPTLEDFIARFPHLVERLQRLFAVHGAIALIGLSNPSAILTANLGAGDDVFNGDFAFPPGPCKVSIMGGDGNDNVSCIDRNNRGVSNPNVSSTAFNIDLGAGDDVFNGDIQFPPGPCRVTVNAGAGDDVVALNAMLDHNSGGFNFTATLGLGNDHFDGNIQFPADSSVGTDPLFPPGPCRVSVMGDGGADSISALIGLLPIAAPAGSNGELIGLTPVGDAQLPIEVVLNGGEGNDFVRNTFSNVNLNGRTTGDLQGGAGNDYVNQRFANATINAGLDLNANGGAGDDYVVVTAVSESRTDTSSTPMLNVNSQVRMNLQGDLGNDHLIGLVIPCIMPVGSLDLIFSGGSGNDLFNLLIGLEPIELDTPSDPTGAPTQDGPIRLAVLGGNGDDQLNLTVQNLGNSTSPFDVRLDGGAGRDTALASPGGRHQRLDELTHVRFKRASLGGPALRWFHP